MLMFRLRTPLRSPRRHMRKNYLVRMRQLLVGTRNYLLRTTSRSHETLSRAHEIIFYACPCARAPYSADGGRNCLCLRVCVFAFFVLNVAEV